MITQIYNIGKIVTWDNNSNNIIILESKDLEVIIKNDVIISVGKKTNNHQTDQSINAKGGLITPGFIDCHTHPIFSGNRSYEFELRMKGATYQEISEKGGGIKFSIKQLRESSKEQIFEQSLKRVNTFLKNGTTTIEAKSGYGLTLKDEIKSLEVIKMLNQESDLNIIPTFMGAHDFPLEYQNNKDGYVDLICEEMIPRISDEKLAMFCDVFCEQGYFTVSQTEKILRTGLKYGLLPRLHADEFIDSGAAQLAADLKISSADHLMHSSIEGLKAMADNNVISVILPGTTFFLGKKEYVDTNKILDVGGEVAIASDYNPGSCTIQSMPMIMFLSNLYCNLSLELSFKACTYNAAKALNIDNEYGLIKEGYKADLLIWDIENLSDIPYMFNNNDRYINIIKNGKIIN